MAHLCSIDPRLRTERNETTVLLLVEPESLDGLGELLSLRERYAPLGSVWVYEDTASPRLRAARPEELASWKGAGDTPSSEPLIPENTSAPHQPPGLRLIGEGVLPLPRPEPAGNIPAPEPDVKFRPGSAPGGTAGTVPNVPTRTIFPTTLTPEELAVLLALEPGKGTTS
jgi:hypothetical protein